MYKTYEYRLYPNKEQKEIFAKHFGCSRFIYNFFLAQRIKLYETEKKKLSCFDCTKQISIMKKQEEYEWLKEVNSQSLYQQMFNLESAFTKFFREHTGFPKFKSKKLNRHSFHCPQNVSVNFENNTIKLPKISPVKCILHRKFEGKIKTCTIKKTPTNKYFVSILVETTQEIPRKPIVEEQTAIGIDLGIKDFAICSNGKKYENPSFLKQCIKRLKVLQKRASKKVIGSSNRRKANFLVALQHEKITNKRKDFLHKVSYELTHDNQVKTVCMETLSVSNMIKNHNLAQSIHDVSWSKFNEMLDYKTYWYGLNLLRIGRFEPSSKTCSNCGYVKSDLTLTDREWVCPECKTHHDRDLNASINIKKFALIGNKLMSRQELPVEPVELLSLEGAVKQEATTSLGRV